MAPMSFHSVVMHSDNEVDLVLRASASSQVTYRFGVDPDALVPTLRCPRNYIRDQASRPRALNWPIDLVRAAITARRRPLPAGRTLRCLEFDRLARSSRAPAQPPPEPPKVPQLLTFRGAFLRSPDVVGVVYDDSLGGTMEWTFMRERSAAKCSAFSASFEQQYRHVIRPGTNDWPITVANLAFAALAAPLRHPSRVGLPQRLIRQSRETS